MRGMPHTGGDTESQNESTEKPAVKKRLETTDPPLKSNDANRDVSIKPPQVLIKVRDHRESCKRWGSKKRHVTATVYRPASKKYDANLQSLSLKKGGNIQNKTHSRIERAGGGRYLVGNLNCKSATNRNLSKVNGDLGDMDHICRKIPRDSLRKNREN